LMTLDLFETKSPEEVADSVAKGVARVAADQWVIGRGWNQNNWEVKAFPGHEILDKVSPNNPVLLRRVDGHAMWVNQRVLDLAKITAQTPDPDGGKVYRDAKGNPTGVLVDNAMNLVENVIPLLTDQEIEDRLKMALDECAAAGLTEVGDMGIDMQTINAYKRLIDAGKCPIRVYAAIGGPGETWDYYLKHGKEVNYGNGMLTVRAIKLYMDGALGSRGAALLESYSDDPGNRGLTVMRIGEIDSACVEALNNGFQVCTHAIGDRGNFIILNEYAKALNALPKSAPSLRWRVEHAQILQPSDIPRFAQLGVIPSMQPTHATSDMYWVESRLGRDRLVGAYAWRSILQTGSIIAGGSDFPVESVKPLWGFYAAVSRSDKTGYPQDGWRPDQKMTRLEAARAFTSWASYAQFQEDTKGTIENGKWADLTVLSKDIMQVPNMDILSTDVIMTIVNGKIVYSQQNIAQ
ncbi:MAG TPA: amidohydrolase, partial [Bacteroidota bacterium]|nr:amidohydrolase [Bacteroidota bacterium]